MWDWHFALAILPELMRGLWVTLEAVVGGMLLALIVGLIWALARRSTWWPLSSSVALVVEFVRSTPLLVQLYFVYFVFPEFGISLAPLTAGILALGLHYSCYTSEVYRAGLAAVPSGQWEAAHALNFSDWKSYRYIVLPQAIPPVLPVLGNYLIAMFKDTPVLSAITVLEIFQRATIVGKQTFRFLEPLTMVGVIYLLLSLISGWCIAWLTQRTQVTK